MVKVIFLMSRKESDSLEKFKKWLLKEHVAFARELPGLKSYVANPLLKDDPGASYDAVTELYFENEAAIADAFSTEAGEAAGNNVAEHCSNTSRMVCEETTLI